MNDIHRIDYKNFVETVRAVEQSLGIYDPLSKVIPTSENEQNFMNATQAIATTGTLSSLNPEVCKVLQQAVPIILQIASDLGINLDFEHDGLGSSLLTRRPLVTILTKYVLNSESVSGQRIDNIAVLWMSAGNLITLLTLLV